MTHQNRQLHSRPPKYGKVLPHFDGRIPGVPALTAGFLGLPHPQTLFNLHVPAELRDAPYTIVKLTVDQPVPDGLITRVK
jgi:hypothetical protein